MRFQTKNRQLEDALGEAQFLREELDSRLQELDRLKLHEMKFDASFKLKELDNVSDITARFTSYFLIRILFKGEPNSPTERAN